jgi:hypothetical protein
MPMLRRVERQEKAQFATWSGELSAIREQLTGLRPQGERKNKIRPRLLVGLLSFDLLPPFAC